MLQSDHFFLSFICQNDISTEMYDGLLIPLMRNLFLIIRHIKSNIGKIMFTTLSKTSEKKKTNST